MEKKADKIVWQITATPKTSHFLMGGFWRKLAEMKSSDHSAARFAYYSFPIYPPRNIKIFNLSNSIFLCSKCIFPFYLQIIFPIHNENYLFALLFWSEYFSPKELFSFYGVSLYRFYQKELLFFTPLAVCAILFPEKRNHTMYIRW